MRRAFILTAALTASAACCRVPEDIGVIPCPQVVERGHGAVTLRPGEVRVEETLDSALGKSCYVLDIDEEGVRVRAGDSAGLFYAGQTLRQIIPADSSEVTLDSMHIEDWPEFGYRGLMLDVARHFFGVDEVKTVLDIMALHKLNHLHLHLTDDQGWRVEIKAYPELVKTGSVRRRTLIGKDPGGEYDGTELYDETPYSGHYTQEQIREIVEYAAGKHITVVPEIEFPGHAVAALASYPWLGCTGEKYAVRETWDIDDRVFCIGKETTFEFMENVLSEIMELFPSPYIHIGGDECPDKMWRCCPACARRMREEGIETCRQLQGYGVRRLEKFLSSHGRSLIGWDEILEAGVEPSATVMSWRGTESGIRAARSGNHVIMSPSEYSYFDYYQFDSTVVQPLAWGGYLPLEKVYSFDPYAGLDGNQRRLVLGVQANLWTEYIPSIGQLEYMMLPRLAAFCETAWSPSKKNFNRFLSSYKRFERFYASSGYDYAVFAENED